MFFMEWFKMIDRWAAPDGIVWRAECETYAGFCRLMNEPEIVSQQYYREEIVAHIHQRFSQFLKVILKNPDLHKDSVKTKSAVKILYRIRSVFPRERTIAEHIRSELDKILKRAKEQEEIPKDVVVLIKRYH